MSEIQQSPLYGKYMTRLKWMVLVVDGIQVFFRQLPLMGGIMKIHRPEKLPELSKLLPVIKENHINTLVIEPIASQNQNQFNHWCRKVSSVVKLNLGLPYLPTKTICIDITPKEEQIFHQFSEAKRRAVRRSQKLGVTIQISENIRDLIKIKNKSSGLFGFITTTGIDKLWDVFAPNHSTILLAYHSNKVVGGILLLFWDHIAYYWIAGATHEGKKLFAPTLLVWEALKISKKRKCKSFDLVGVWDERAPHQNREWLGFTKFKEGFGGSTKYYGIHDPVVYPTFAITIL